MSSGSADSDVAVKPTRSQNSAVTTLRSSAGRRRARDEGAAARTAEPLARRALRSARWAGGHPPQRNRLAGLPEGRRLDGCRPCSIVLDTAGSAQRAAEAIPHAGRGRDGARRQLRHRAAADPPGRPAGDRGLRADLPDPVRELRAVQGRSASGRRRRRRSGTSRSSRAWARARRCPNARRRHRPPADVGDARRAAAPPRPARDDPLELRGVLPRADARSVRRHRQRRLRVHRRPPGTRRCPGRRRSGWPRCGSSTVRTSTVASSTRTTSSSTAGPTPGVPWPRPGALRPRVQRARPRALARRSLGRARVRPLLRAPGGRVRGHPPVRLAVGSARAASGPSSAPSGLRCPS